MKQSKSGPVAYEQFRSPFGHSNSVPQKTQSRQITQPLPTPAPTQYRSTPQSREMHQVMQQPLTPTVPTQEMKKVPIWDVNFLSCQLKDPSIVIIIPDIFYQRLYADLDWTMMQSPKHPILWFVPAVDFEQIYVQIEERYWSSTVHRSARDIFDMIIKSQATYGYPYVKGMDQGKTTAMAKL